MKMYLSCPERLHSRSAPLTIRVFTTLQLPWHLLPLKHWIIVMRRHLSIYLAPELSGTVPWCLDHASDGFLVYGRCNNNNGSNNNLHKCIIWDWQSWSLIPHQPSLGFVWSDSAAGDRPEHRSALEKRFLQQVAILNLVNRWIWGF